MDAFCCNTAWDSICASEALAVPECVAGCTGDGGGDGGAASNCCVPNGGLGCDDAACQASVCAADAFCCNTAWDSICASEAAADPNCPC
jgi:hypothetical protein